MKIFNDLYFNSNSSSQSHFNFLIITIEEKEGGNMFLSKKGKYWYVIYTVESTGRRTSISTKSKLKSDAYKFLSEFKVKLKPKQRIISLLDLKSEVIKHISYHLRKSTILLYETAFRNMEKLWGNIWVKSITLNHIEKYKIYRLNNGVKKASVNKDLRTMHAIFNLAYQWGYIQSNPSNGVKKFKLDEKEKLAFSESEIEKISDQVNDTQLKNIIIFALNTGCRFR